jgi:hypothetical protein
MLQVAIIPEAETQEIIHPEIIIPEVVIPEITIQGNG